MPKNEDYAYRLEREEIISDFLGEFCKQESYFGEIFDITPKELLRKFFAYYKNAYPINFKREMECQR